MSAIAQRQTAPASPEAIVLAALDDSRLASLGVRYYGQAHRRYHDLQHIAEMFELANWLGLTLDTAQRLAILFHDAVFATGAPVGQNEELSAILLENIVACDDRLCTPYANAVPCASAIIRDTANHRSASVPGAKEVLDLDLARLAAPWPEFWQHCIELSYEGRAAALAALGPAAHAVASDAELEDRVLLQFLKGALHFYDDMLRRDTIYHSDLGRATFEAQARANMSHMKSLLTEALLDEQPGITLHALARVPGPMVGPLWWQGQPGTTPTRRPVLRNTSRTSPPDPAGGMCLSPA